MRFRDWLKENDACDEARKWVGNRGVLKAWRECEEWRWLEWFAANLRVDFDLRWSAQHTVLRRKTPRGKVNAYRRVIAEDMIARAWRRERGE